jgi:hypothetical protein
MQLILKRKNVYGNELIYPVNNTAVIFANLIGKKTFTANDLDLISCLNYEIIFE